MKANTIFWLCIIVSILACAAIYGIYFDDLSETSMMQIAYGLVFFAVTGIAGLVAKNSPKQVTIALVSGVAALALLFLFYSTIWPSL